jgi:soluble lytic murein transglycosylase
MTASSRSTLHLLRLGIAMAALLALVGCDNAGRPATLAKEPTDRPIAAVTIVPPTAAPTATDTPAPPTATPAPTEPVTALPPTAPPEPTGTPAATEDPPASSSVENPAEEGALPPEIERALGDGDYARAIALLEETLRAEEPAHRVPMVLALARAYRAEERHTEAIALLAAVIEEARSEDEAADILALLATSYEALGEWRAAVDAYERYLAARPEAAPDVRWHMAKAFAALEAWEQAEGQLAAVDQSALSTSRRAEMLEELASVRLDRQDVDGALQAYDEILAFAENAPYRALIVQKQGDALREAGRNEEAIARYTAVVTEHAATYAAFTALDALDQLGVAVVNDYDRARILYQGGQYEACVEALHRHLPTIPGEQAAPVYYLAGQAFHQLERYDEAIQSYDAVIAQFPGDAVAADAWFGKASTVAAAGGDAVSVYQAFAAAHPDHARAPEALWLAASTLERARDWERAGAAYRDLRTRYPSGNRAVEASFREGLAAYARGDMDAATAAWSASLEAGRAADERARLHTWLGLAADQRGDREAATNHWQQARAASPTYYYGLRARDLLAGITPVLPERTNDAIPSTAMDAAKWEEAAFWVASWAPAAEGESTSVSDHPLLRRGSAYLALGWHSEAVADERALLDAVKDQPRLLLSLTRASREAGLHAVTLSCANRLRILGREAGAAEAPDALWGLSYPTTYGHLVADECRRRGVDPLLFLALTRQESGFDAEAVSYAGATGLTQVMPATGADIARSLGEGNYRPTILTRPVVSVRYGVYYLAMLLERYNRDWIAALVGYNAGPGNMSRWTNNQPIADHDLFYETLPLQQPQDYIRLIYQNYSTYVALYRRY